MNAATVIFTDPDLAQRAQHKARTLGLTLSAYVIRLVAADTHLAHKLLAPFPSADSWGPVPASVANRWDEEERQFAKEEKKGKQKGFQTVEALMHDLNT